MILNTDISSLISLQLKCVSSSQKFAISIKHESKGWYSNFTYTVFYECSICKLLSWDVPIRVENHEHSNSWLGAFDCNQESYDHLTKSAGNKIYLEFCKISLTGCVILSSFILTVLVSSLVVLLLMQWSFNKRENMSINTSVFHITMS